jgi:hypothetical protein
MVRASTFCEQNGVGGAYKQILVKEMNRRLKTFEGIAVPVATDGKKSEIKADVASEERSAPDDGKAPVEDQPVFTATEPFDVPVTLDGQQLTLSIKKGDKVAEVVKKFCSEHQIPDEKLQPLIQAVVNARPGATTTATASDDAATQPQSEPAQAEAATEAATETQPETGSGVLLFSLPVNVDGRKKQLRVFDGDVSKFPTVAEKFCQKYSLTPNYIPALVKVRSFV